MLTLLLCRKRLYDEKAQEFVIVPQVELHLEHSLLSIRRWESKWKKSFFDSKKSVREIIDYIRCMTINTNVDEIHYITMSNDELSKCLDYINDTMTATVIFEKNQKNAKQSTITAEIIYYNMLSLGIPFECEKWHINQLLTLMKVCSIKNNPKNKMSRKETVDQHREINKARRNALKQRKV